MAERLVPTDTHVPLHVELRELSKQYSYDAALVEAAQVRVAAVRETPLDPLTGVLLPKVPGST